MSVVDDVEKEGTHITACRRHANDPINPRVQQVRRDWLARNILGEDGDSVEDVEGNAGERVWQGKRCEKGDYVIKNDDEPVKFWREGRLLRKVAEGIGMLKQGRV